MAMTMTMVEQPPQASDGGGPSHPGGDGAPESGGQPRRRRGGRGRGRGGRGRGSGADDGDQRDSRPRQTDGQEGGQPAANADGDAANKKNRRRGPRRRGRGGGGRGSDAAENDAPVAILSRNDAVAIATGAAMAAEQAESQLSPRTQQVVDFVADSLAGTNIDAVAAATNDGDAKAADVKQKQSKQKQADAAKEKEKKKKKRRPRRKQPKSAPWRQFIPPGLEDPISLEPLEKLPYPPFAILAEPPYTPVLPGMWPPPPIEPTAILSKNGDNNTKIEEAKAEDSDKPKAEASVNNEKDREMEILKDQWGDGLVSLSKKDSETEDATTAPDDTTINSPTNNSSIQGRHVNLFDGQVLAYYLVSTLQFIDPFNRRNLTRPELQALDAYLAHHNLGNAGVVEAYDDKGVSVSTASSEAQTSTGRAQILQQEASAILGSLYRGRGGQSRAQQHRRREEGRQNDFQRMYAAQGGNRHAPPQSSRMEQPVQDTGVYEGEGGGGLLIIDDDINPGLRGGVPGSDLGSSAGGSTLYSARHIAEHHSQAAQVREGNFPSLASTAPPPSVSAESRDANGGVAASTASKKLPPSGPAPKSLSKISKLVKKTDPKQVERQRKAREEAQRRSEMSKMAFFNPDVANASAAAAGVSNVGALPTAPAAKQPPSEAVLERNRNLAMALGVAPSTVRNEPSLTGWARPVNAPAGPTDEFGNELNAAQYPDALLAEARERMTELLKLERQWKKFLADDRAASCSLKPMARPLRKFVHEYSDFWRLKSESFDPEGRRYIQCGKLADTAAPYPMLSEAARRWRGPTAGPTVGSVDVAALPTGPSLKPSLPTAAAPPASDGWRTEQRVPLKLAPRTVAEEAKPTQPSAIPRVASTSGMTRSSSTPLLSMTGEVPTPARFADLHSKERPRLQLAPRSIPTWDELEKRNISQEEWNAMTADQQEKVLVEIEEEEARKKVQMQREKEKEEARVQRKETKEKKKRELMVKKKAILESAFASSSDDGDDGSSGSDWFEGDLEFDGSDDEGM